MSTPGYSRILIPTDGSQLAPRALDEALNMVVDQETVLHILYVVNHRSILTLASDPGEGFVGPGQDVERLFERHTIAGDDAVTKLTKSASAAGINVVSEVRHGTPADVILAYIVEEDIDLVIMGTHARGGIKRILRGSTTEQVLRQSNVPILAVPDGDRRASSK